MQMSRTNLVFPGLSSLYDKLFPLALTLLRVVVGIMFLVHVSAKFQAGAAAVAANVFAKNGLEPALAMTYVVMFLEVVGGACLVLGLFTRFFAAALAIEMLVALVFVHLSQGYAASAGGYEYVLMIGAACFLLAITGGGPWSVDRAIGKEL